MFLCAAAFVESRWSMRTSWMWQSVPHRPPAEYIYQRWQTPLKMYVLFFCSYFSVQHSLSGKHSKAQTIIVTQLNCILNLYSFTQIFQFREKNHKPHSSKVRRSRSRSLGSERSNPTSKYSCCGHKC